VCYRWRAATVGARAARLAGEPVTTIKLDFGRGDVLASHYEVNDQLAETPLGPTYRVKHLPSGKFLRLTVLRPELTPDPDEVRAQFAKAKDLKHPHLLRLGELSQHERAWFFTYEDFDGKSLRELLSEYRLANRRFSLKDAAQVVNQVLEALAFLHDSGVVLRALRPEHILVNARYAGPRQQNFVAHVKLFGSCMFDLVSGGALVEDEYTRGEAQYLAPELKSFDPVASPRTDLYSAGVVFYEMLAGSAPVGTFLPITQARPEVPKLVDDVIELAMAHAPDDRYRSARDLINGIQRVFEAAATDGEAPARSLPIILAIAAIGSVLVLSASIAIYAFLSSDPDKSAQVKDQQLRVEIKDKHPMPTKAEREAVQAQHPNGMIYVPPGPYVHGRLQHDPHANKGAEPLHEIVEVKGFLIDAFPYPGRPGASPTSKVTWHQARERCEATGKRLCTDREWEKACKGPRNLIYSYGDSFDPEICGPGVEVDYVSGARRECHSEWGVHDLSGGLAEWTATPMATNPDRYMVKGGSVASAERGSRCSYANDESGNYAHATISFRCCRDVDAPPVGGAPEPAPAE
jgi:serine/threonine protein kinase